VGGKIKGAEENPGQGQPIKTTGSLWDLVKGGVLVRRGSSFKMGGEEEHRVGQGLPARHNAGQTHLGVWGLDNMKRSKKRADKRYHPNEVHKRTGLGDARNWGTGWPPGSTKWTVNCPTELREVWEHT